MKLGLIGDVSDDVAQTVAEALARSEHHDINLVTLPDKPKPHLTVVPVMNQILVTSYSVSAQPSSLNGKLIRYLINDPASPLAALELGVVVHHEERGSISFFLTKISPQDLRDVRHMIDNMPRPDSMYGHMSEQSWEICRREVAAQLNLRHQ